MKCKHYHKPSSQSDSTTSRAAAAHSVPPALVSHIESTVGDFTPVTAWTPQAGSLFTTLLNSSMICSKTFLPFLVLHIQTLQLNSNTIQGQSAFTFPTTVITTLQNDIGIFQPYPGRWQHRCSDENELAYNGPYRQETNSLTEIFYTRLGMGNLFVWLV